jgi:hypothetical protein
MIRGSVADRCGRRAVLAVPAVALIVLSCTANHWLLLPGARVSAEVRSRGEHGGYLDLEVRTGDAEGPLLRFFADAAAEGCREIVKAPAGVLYSNIGVVGRLLRDELRCDLIGVLSLRELRDRRPRRSGEPLPRSRADYRVVHRDAELALLRGRFGLAGELGWPVGVDTVVALPRGEACDPLLEQSHASMEFRSAGRQPLVLLGAAGPCPVLGLAQPLAGSRTQRAPPF